MTIREKPRQASPKRPRYRCKNCGMEISEPNMLCMMPAKNQPPPKRPMPKYRVRQAFNGGWMIDQIAPKFESGVAATFLRPTLARRICKLLNTSLPTGKAKIDDDPRPRCRR